MKIDSLGSLYAEGGGGGGRVFSESCDKALHGGGCLKS